VDVSGTSSSFDLHQSVEFGSGAVHLVVVKPVMATHSNVIADISSVFTDTTPIPTSSLCRAPAVPFVYVFTCRHSTSKQLWHFAAPMLVCILLLTELSFLNVNVKTTCSITVTSISQLLRKVNYTISMVTMDTRGHSRSCCQLCCQSKIVQLLIIIDRWHFVSISYDLWRRTTLGAESSVTPRDVHETFWAEIETRPRPHPYLFNSTSPITR